MALVDRGFVLIVSTGRELAATDPADIAIGLDGINEDVVGMVAVVLAHPATHDAIAGDVAGQIYFHHIVKLHALFLHRLVQLFGLGDIAGETVKQPAVSPFGLQGFEDHGNGDGVRDEFSAIHIFLGLFAEFGSAAHMFAENGSGFDMGQTKRLLDESALRAFAAAVGTEHKDIHDPKSPV